MRIVAPARSRRRDACGRMRPGHVDHIETIDEVRQRPGRPRGRGRLARSARTTSASRAAATWSSPWAATARSSARRTASGRASPARREQRARRTRSASSAPPGRDRCTRPWPRRSTGRSSASSSPGCASSSTGARFTIASSTRRSSATPRRRRRRATSCVASVGGRRARRHQLDLPSPRGAEVERHVGRPRRRLDRRPAERRRGRPAARLAGPAVRGARAVSPARRAAEADDGAGRRASESLDVKSQMRQARLFLDGDHIVHDVTIGDVVTMRRSGEPLVVLGSVSASRAEGRSSAAATGFSHRASLSEAGAVISCPPSSCFSALQTLRSGSD